MIVVTGGAGFIGSNILKGLNDAGEENILVVDNLTNSQKHLNLNRLSFTDYMDKDDFLASIREIKNIHTIFHQGACSSTTEQDGKYMMTNNYEYSKKILNNCLENNINFIYASSAAVYGNGDNGFAEEPKAEYPLNVYGFSKFAFDNYVRRVMPEAEIQILGLRYFNVYGPQENHKERMSSVAFHMFNELQDSGKMRLFEGSEEFRRDFIHVTDAVRINLYFYQTKHSGIFNAGTGKSRSFTEIARAMQDIHGGGEIEDTPFPKDLVGKYQKFTEADLDNLRQTGFSEDFMSLEEGLKKYYDQLSLSNGLYI